MSFTKSRRTTLLFTFGATLVLLGAFLGVWWYQSYQKDREALRDMVESEMNRYVSDEFIYPTLQAFLQYEGMPDVGSLLRQGVGPSRGYRQIRIERIIHNRWGQPEGLELTIIGNSRPLANSRFFFENKRIALEHLPQAVRDSMWRKFGIDLQPVSYSPRLRRFDDQYSSLPPEPMLVEIEHVLADTGGYSGGTFIISNYTTRLLLGLLPEFLFGMVLFGATGLAFAAAYRNLREQEQQLRAKDVLVANVAHELKTPIATVGVALEALNTFGADADPARRADYLEIGQTELKRLDAMADRAIHSLQEGDLSNRLSLGNVDLTIAIRKSWKGLALRHGLPEDVLTLTTHGTTVAEVDAHYWDHAVYNLLDNACKYGGRPLAVTAAVTGLTDEIEVTITDNGPGIPAGEREAVFERFYRVYRPGEGHAVKGHGLGLSFVRQIIGAHAGAITVDNAPGGGARFTVRLPR